MMFGKYPAGGFEAKTLEQSRAEGFETGLTWNQNYVPGGPFVHAPGEFMRDDKDWQAYCHHTVTCHQVWMEGFHDGIKERDKRRLLETVVREPGE
jgi:hypothetical protein